MNTRKCAVCDKVKATSEFGDGITCPKTTCLECKAEIVKFVDLGVSMVIKRFIKGETCAAKSV